MKIWPTFSKREGLKEKTFGSFGKSNIPLRYDTVYGKRVVDRSYDIETARMLYTLEDGTKYYRYYDENHFYPAAKPARSARNPSACPGCGSTNAHNSVFKYDEKLVPNSTLHTRRKPEEAYVMYERTRERARLMQEANRIEQLLNSSRHDSILDDFDRRWRAEIEKKNIGRIVQQIVLEIASITAEYREANAIHAMREFETQGRFIQSVYGKSQLEIDLEEVMTEEPYDNFLRERLAKAV